MTIGWVSIACQSRNYSPRLAGWSEFIRPWETPLESLTAKKRCWFATLQEVGPMKNSFAYARPCVHTRLRFLHPALQTIR